jgi:hypothetical protein
MVIRRLTPEETAALFDGPVILFGPNRHVPTPGTRQKEVSQAEATKSAHKAPPANLPRTASRKKSTR